MKVLLDESLPSSLAKDLRGHKVSTVAQAGWAGKKNGELLKLAESRFEVFITIDQNLQYQVNLMRAKIPIVVLSAKTNRYDDLKPLISKILSALRDPGKGIIRVS